MKSNQAWRADNAHRFRIKETIGVSASPRWNGSVLWLDVSNIDAGGEVQLIPAQDIGFQIWEYSIVSGTGITDRKYTIDRRNTKTGVDTSIASLAVAAAGRVSRAAMCVIADTTFGLNDTLVVGAIGGSGAEDVRFFIHTRTNSSPTGNR